MMDKGRILIVDDLSDVGVTLSGLLTDKGYAVSSASSKDDALQILSEDEFDVALVDIRLDETDENNKDGLLLMHEIKRMYPSVATIILTGYADIKTVKETLQPDIDGTSPAIAFLEKSNIEQVQEYVERAFEYRRHNG